MIIILIIFATIIASLHYVLANYKRMIIALYSSNFKMKTIKRHVIY